MFPNFDSRDDLLEHHYIDGKKIYGSKPILWQNGYITAVHVPTKAILFTPRSASQSIPTILWWSFTFLDFLVSHYAHIYHVYVCVYIYVISQNDIPIYSMICSLQLRKIYFPSYLIIYLHYMYINIYNQSSIQIDPVGKDRYNHPYAYLYHVDMDHWYWVHIFSIIYLVMYTHVPWNMDVYYINH